MTSFLHLLFLSALAGAAQGSTPRSQSQSYVCYSSDPSPSGTSIGLSCPKGYVVKVKGPRDYGCETNTLEDYGDGDIPAHDLLVPASAECLHVLTSTDTLSALALAYGTTPAALIALNPPLSPSSFAAASPSSTMVTIAMPVAERLNGAGAAGITPSSRDAALAASSPAFTCFPVGAALAVPGAAVPVPALVLEPLRRSALSSKGGVVWSFESQEVDITVATAAHIRQAHAGCADRYLASFRNGTVFPKQIVIVFQAPTDEDNTNLERHREEIRRLERKWSSSFTSLDLMLQLNQTYKGSNMDLAISKATGALVSMFDLDDEPHPQRLEVIQAVFRIHQDLEVLLTGFVVATPSDDWITPVTLDDIHHLRYSYASLQDSYTTFIDTNHHGDPEMTNSPRVQWCCGLVDGWAAHNGWSTSRRQVFDKIGFSYKHPVQHNSIVRGSTVEDSVFISKAIYWFHFNVSAVTLELGRYNMSPKRKQNLGSSTCFE